MRELKHNTVDARGRSCPEPVLLTKKAIDQQQRGKIVVLVDSGAATENVARLAKKAGWKVTIKEDGTEYTLTLQKE